jgi:hypothetical protein
VAAVDRLAMIKLLNISALSYSGTTWLNLLLGSHPEVLTIGPLHRLIGMLDTDLSTACLIHGADCSFWPAFARQRDREENLFVELRKFSGRSVFVFDNCPADFLAAHGRHPKIRMLPGRYIRDGRAISASYARKMRSKNISYLDSIGVDGWLYKSFQNVPGLAELEKSGAFYARYEDVTADPAAFLKRAGDYLGLSYPEDAHRFWQWDHHITSGNQGPIEMVRQHQALPAREFESRQVYADQLERLNREPMAPFADDRWRAQLSREELFWFDRMMGRKNAEFGYERDRFSQAEVLSFGGSDLVKRPPPGSRIRALAKWLRG